MTEENNTDKNDQESQEDQIDQNEQNNENDKHDKNFKNTLIFNRINLDIIGAELCDYTDCFKDLNFEQNRFKFCSNLIESCKKSITSIEASNAFKPLHFNKLQEQLNNDEIQFENEIKALEQKSNNLERKVSSFAIESDYFNIFRDFKKIILQEMNYDFEKQEEMFEDYYNNFQLLKEQLDLSHLFKDNLEGKIKSVIQRYDSNLFTLTSSKAKLFEIKRLIENNKAKYKSVENNRNHLEQILYRVGKTISSSFNFDKLRNYYKEYKSLFHISMEEFTLFKNSIETISKRFDKNYFVCIEEIKSYENESKVCEQIVDDLNNQKSVLMNKHHQILEEIEKTFLATKNEECQFIEETENLNKEIQASKICESEKLVILDEITKQLDEIEIKQENLRSYASKLEDEILNFEKDKQTLNETLEMIDKEEVILNRKATDIKIQMAVENTLQEQYKETKLLHENKILQIQNSINELRKIISEKLVRNQEKKEKPFLTKEKQRIEMENLNKEFKEISEQHSKIFAQEVPDCSGDLIQLLGDCYTVSS